MHIKTALLLPCLLLVVQLTAQQELMLNTLPEIWHSNTLNPAFFPKDKHFVIGLPAYALDAAHSGDIAYKDVFVKKDGKTVIDFGNAIGQLDPQNEIYLDQRIETLSLGLRLGKGLTLQAGHANRLTGVIGYPKSLPELIWNGNAPYIGQNVQIAPRATLFDWNEWSAGASLNFGKLSIGGRFKLLTGISSLRTDAAHQSASIYTDPDIYQLTLNTDYAFHSSSLISAFDTSGLGFDLDIAKVKGKVFSSNTGAAFDLGFQLKVSERLTISASALDLGGKINWTENANYWRSNGSYEYKGVTFPGANIISGFDSLDFNTKLDTLNDIFQFKKTSEKFTTTLPARYYLGAQYQLNDHWQLGLSALIQDAEDRRNVAVGGSIRWQALKWFSLGAMYSVNDRSSANFGFQTALKVGPAQVYFTSDNLLNAFSIKSSPAVNLRAGAALIF